MKKALFPGLFLSVVLLFTACDSKVNHQGGSNGRILPNVTGGAGEVLVVMDNFNWENKAGEALRDILLSEVPALPQSEPMYDITQITSSAFDGFFQYHRTVIVNIINPSLEKSELNFGKDVWARPQIVVELKAPSAEQLAELITNNHDKILNFLVQYERSRLMNIYKASKDDQLDQQILKDHKVSVVFPRGYNLDFSNAEYSSVSIETPDYSQVVQVYEFPADDPEALSTENLMSKRNMFTKKYVKGPNDTSYMEITTLIPPLVYDLKMDNQDVVEIRGLWELKNGFMGGPFVSHAVYDAARKRVVVIDGYVYYPNQKKRIKMRQVEAVIYSLKLI